MSLPNLYAPPVLGKNLTSAIWTPITVDSAGASTAGTPIQLAANLDGIGATTERGKEEISPMNTTRTNEVQVTIGTRGSVEVYKTLNGTIDDLRVAVLAAEYGRLVWVENGVTKTLFHGVGNDDDSSRGKGKQTFTFEITPADFGASTYTEV